MNELVYSEFHLDGKLERFVERIAAKFEMYSYPIYVIQRPLGTDENYEYTYKNAVVVLIPKHKLLFIDLKEDKMGFESFRDDFIEDIGHLSDRYQYKKAIGRPREWQRLVSAISINEIDENNPDPMLDELCVEHDDERRVELLITLLVGSINEVTAMSAQLPQTLLEGVKQKIVLFDGMQSRFIYEHVDQKVVRIQGLAGTGKTELLLHRLKRMYVSDKTSKIAFTCFNHVLAEEMRSRLPAFFNYMKVDEQIDWKARLFVFPSWGSKYNSHSGMYSYICNTYSLHFLAYSHASFSNACTNAIEELKSKAEPIKPCFTYVFIDESQDFSEDFISLCNMVTEKQVYVAGDIFQNIFDMNIKNDVNCDYLLNKCYRTDPRTLMFAHSVGMGLYESPIIRWLSPKEWKACGYQLTNEPSSQIKFERMPVRRFDDDSSLCAVKSIQMTGFQDGKAEKTICSCIDKIIDENPGVCPDDIGIIFTNGGRVIYEVIDRLASMISKRLGWQTCKGHITKQREQGKMYISNINNIKGLEFPFVICVSLGRITRNVLSRNSIYMALTRSFIASYFLVEISDGLIDSKNADFFNLYADAVEHINSNYCMLLRQPDKTEIETQEAVVRITASSKKSVEEIIADICKDYPDLKPKHIATINGTVPSILQEETEEEVIQKTLGMISLILGHNATDEP